MSNAAAAIMSTNQQFIIEPALLSVLSAAANARQQCISMLDLIAESGASSSYEVDQLLAPFQKTLHARLAILRGLNRKAVMSVRATKQETTEARQEIDSLHLQLQNLYYEQRHLRGEIRACEEYDHVYARLPMATIDEFLATHPDFAARGDLNEHDLTVARIEDEHRARLALEEQRLGLVKRKEALLKETGAKKEELGKLDAEIEKWIAGQETVTKILEMRTKKVEKAEDKAQGESSAAET